MSQSTEGFNAQTSQWLAVSITTDQYAPFRIYEQEA
jgi:hypothetical protein